MLYSSETLSLVLPGKINASNSFNTIASHQEIPTLHISLKNIGTTHELEIIQTHFDAVIDQKWSIHNTLPGLRDLDIIHTPWHAVLEIKYSTSTGLILRSLPQGDYYIPFNYVIITDTELDLKYIITSGYVDASASKIVAAVVDAHTGIQLRSQTSIDISDDLQD